MAVGSIVAVGVSVAVAVQAGVNVIVAVGSSVGVAVGEGTAVFVGGSVAVGLGLGDVGVTAVAGAWATVSAASSFWMAIVGTNVGGIFVTVRQAVAKMGIAARSRRRFFIA
ncbi:MAG: hypothetical protein DHS20C20_00010 [Ardenticatenaceae bacterium]|nr:MAG: hypothetical protein DHS20C20_00010 [Ardenticatenaceae bacterium]